ncbi:MAG: DoxX family protein [Flavobacterium sp.]|uniref:DoxX family protein n=1 Tax=unclassified Flavobacterium TaxID=196869 RepID=UPI000C4E4A24|nr:MULTISPECIES: DoxX family protein [unclassified Flavobacterium]MBF02708.1 DoxX family protein [Flavobacterium sp.]MCO6161723.1 DoxX family protein [Flavobacterium sp. NRK F7]|tara:strand:- start:883 stop:1266 length:384 start_codon:yes stop_codon:yes gene_type:complete
MIQVAPILLLSLLSITFLQSGYDKIKDWKGNISWLKGHFSGTIFGNTVPLALFIILILEIFSGVLCVSGIIELFSNQTTEVGYYGAILSCITLLFLLFGQRIAKDYDGARTIVIYFIPAIIAVYLLG